jgi:hypothetical protein
LEDLGARLLLLHLLLQILNHRFLFIDSFLQALDASAM